MISNMKIVEPQVELWKQEPTLKGVLVSNSKSYKSLLSI
jgi:hypothetical protein